MGAARAVIRLAEAFEDVRNKFGADTFAGISHGYGQLGIINAPKLHLHAPAAGVNFTGFESRFQSACCKRARSATTAPIVSSAL
jgi:hypothetical protein